MAAPTNQVSLTNLINPLDPSSATNAYQIQRQMAYAKALQDQAFQPNEAGQMVSGWYVPTSNTAHIAKMAQALLAGYAGKKADANAGELRASTMQALAKALDPNGPAQAVAPSVASSAALSMGGQSGAPAPAQPSISGPTPQPGEVGAQTNRIGPTPQTAAMMDNMTSPPAGSTGSPLNPLGMNAMLAAQLANTDWGKYLETQAGAYKQADIVGKLRAAGIDPNSPQGRQFALENIKKDNYIAPINARAGSTVLDPITRQPIFNAPSTEGIQYTFDQNGMAKVNQVPGFTDAVSAYEAARKRGQNTQTLAPKDMLPTMPNGQVQPRTIADTITPPNSRFPGNGLSPTNGRLAIMQDEKSGILARPDTDPRKAADLAAINREIAALGGSVSPAAPAGLGPAFGQEEGAKLAQNELSRKWAAQQQAHQGAETSSSYLQSIAKLADKAATGRFSDRLDFVNSLLSSVGNEKATDAVSANDLMDKYKSQIIQQLGGGATGTDAYRAIIGEGTPGAQMNVPAIKEAVSNLIGKNEMIKARTNILSGSANSRDPVSYGQKEMVFDQNADPRIWQWKNIQDPKAKAAFAASILKTDPNFPAKIKALEKIGAF